MTEQEAIALVRSTLAEMGFGSLWTGTMEDAGVDSMDRLELAYRLEEVTGAAVGVEATDTIHFLAARLVTVLASQKKE